MTMRMGAICAVTLALLAAPARAVETGTAGQGVLRVLDKITGVVTDLDLSQGETRQIGALSVTLGECRYPAANPSGDAFALVEISDNRQGEPVFQGWLIASAPALHALDHPRYDVWVLRCVVP